MAKAISSAKLVKIWRDWGFVTSWQSKLFYLNYRKLHKRRPTQEANFIMDFSISESLIAWFVLRVSLGKDGIPIRFPNADSKLTHERGSFMEGKSCDWKRFNSSWILKLAFHNQGEMWARKGSHDEHLEKCKTRFLRPKMILSFPLFVVH